jgi:protein-L-isoaspartate(D-aspartate) O-methyltransferase
VLEAFRSVDRALFVPDSLKSLAYEDSPLSIGYGQTISQPFIVAFMTEAAMLNPRSKVLEIGTGSGYQAAILSKLCAEVYSIEMVEPLLQNSKKLLKDLGYNNVHAELGDGYKGWKEAAPFDAIIVTAAPKEIPQTLIEQLKIGGRMIIPIGDFNQRLTRIIRTKEGIEEENLISVRFVPMVKDKQKDK